MSQILADAEMEKQLEAATGPIQVVNSKGTVIGNIMPIKRALYTPEEIERRRQEIEKRRAEARAHPELGKSIAEVWAEIHRQHGENP